MVLPHLGYAPRLLSNLDWLDWSPVTKQAQRNWIGKSEGAQLTFAVSGRSERITVFTTRADTIFGATYLVLAPEHPLVASITTDAQRSDVAAYQERATKQDLISRKSSKDKTGVFTGAYAVNPATGQNIPIWIADYVLMEYGTGAIMAVPGHDERDFEFAQVFDLPVVRVVAAADQQADTALGDAAFTDDDDACRLVNSGPFDGLAVRDAKREVTAWLADGGMARP